MAIAFDAATTGANDTSSSFTIAITVDAAGTNRLLVVGISAQDSTLADRQVSTVKIGTTAFTQAIETDSPDDHSEIWYLIAPPTGAQTVTITMNGACAGLRGGAISLTGVNQSSPIANTSSATGDSTSQSLSIDTTVDNAWIVDNVAIAGVAAV